MSSNAHERARKLVLASRVEGDSTTDRAWLHSHLEACQSCCDYANTLEAVVAGVRAAAVTADEGLVSATQARVRQRRLELMAQQEAARPMWIAAAMACGTTLLSTPLVWEMFAWLGHAVRVQPVIWNLGFVFFWIAPTIAFSVLMAAYGSHAQRWRPALRQEVGTLGEPR